MSHKRISNYLISMDKKLGQGAFGTVYHCKQDKTNIECAVKVLDKKISKFTNKVVTKDEYLKKAIFQEIKIMQTIKSQNVVGVMDVLESSNNYYIIQELCDGDFDGLLSKRGKLPEDQAISFLKQICNGFITLVREGVVHRDLKPANLMLRKGVIKIGDFGLAKKNITKRIKNQSSVGTPLYSPLQLMIGQPYTSKCDVWAVGCIFYQMLHGRTPWNANSQFQLVQNIRKIPISFRPELHGDTRDFISSCLALQQQNRLSWDQVFNHPIFKGYFKEYALQNEKFENKMKMVMSELRFQINSRNLNLKKLLESLGFHNKSELTYQQFTLFIGHIQPHITKQEIGFFMQKMDENQDGVISLPELQAKMKEHDIEFDKDIELQLTGLLKLGTTIRKAESIEEMLQPDPLSEELQRKARKTFNKLYKILKAKKLTLYKVFKAYDQDTSGEISKEEFEKLMKRLDGSLESEQIAAIFDYIDNDFSGTIDFEQLNTYHCKINGIPDTLDVPPEYFEEKKKRMLQ